MKAKQAESLVVTTMLTLAAIGAVLFLSQNDLAGQEPKQEKKVPDNVQRYLDRSERQKGWEIEDLEVRIKDAVLWAKRDKRGNNSAKRSGGQMIKSMRAELTELKKPATHCPAEINPLDLQANDVGEFDRAPGDGDHGRFRVLQVLDANNMLVVFEGSQRISSVIGADGRVVVRAGHQDIGSDPIWIDGISTKGIVDKNIVDLGGVFEVVGTKRYETAAGSNTVFHAKPIDVRPFLPAK